MERHDRTDITLPVYYCPIHLSICGELGASIFANVSAAREGLDVKFTIAMLSRLMCRRSVDSGPANTYGRIMNFILATLSFNRYISAVLLTCTSIVLHSSARTLNSLTAQIVRPQSFFWVPSTLELCVSYGIHQLPMAMFDLIAVGCGKLSTKIAENTVYILRSDCLLNRRRSQ